MQICLTFGILRICPYRSIYSFVITIQIDWYTQVQLLFMIPKAIAYCTANHPASKLCCEEDCTSPAVICGNQSCQNNSIHKNCPTLKLQNILDSLEKKSQSAKQGPDQILDFYIRCIKLLTTDMEQYKKTKQKNKCLRLEELKLLQLVYEGPSKQIMPKLVYKVSKSLRKQPDFSLQELLDKQSSTYLFSKKAEIQSLLLKVKKIWNRNKLLTENRMNDSQFSGKNKKQNYHNGKSIRVEYIPYINAKCETDYYAIDYQAQCLPQNLPQNNAPNIISGPPTIRRF